MASGAERAVRIQGRVEPGFEAVRAAFERNFAEAGEIGAGCCVHVDGRPVVDLTGGVADVASGRPYGPDTLQLVFSTTKGVTAICVNLLVERGELELDAPVSAYWPEFAEAGKRDVLVRMLLNHQAGLPTVDRRLRLAEILEIDPIVDALAAQEPVWKPGSAHGYHAITFGFLAGELVRRVTGRRLGRFLADELADPLGLDLHLGLPEEHEARVAPLLPAPRPDDPALAEMMQKIMGPGTLPHRALTLEGAFATADGEEMVWNRREVHASEIPAANAITDARSLSRLYAAAIGEVDGVRVLSPETVARACRGESSGPDRVLSMQTCFGLGFMLPWPVMPLLGEGSFGHAGAGGSVAFAHPESRVAFAYVMSQMAGNLAGDPRSQNLIQAVRASLS